MANLSIQTDHMQNVALIKVRGRVDSDTAPEFDQALSKALVEKNKIVLNLEGVEFLSSAGLRAMVKAYQAAKKSGGDVRLSCVSAPVEVVLRTVGMMQMLQMYSTDQEALEGF
jgi:anti-anti-sigma factor